MSELEFLAEPETIIFAVPIVAILAGAVIAVVKLLLKHRERMALIESKGLAQSGWHLRADQTVSKGTLAYMVCRALDVEGGLMLRLAPGRRYAYREAVEMT